MDIVIALCALVLAVIGNGRPSAGQRDVAHGLAALIAALLIVGVILS